MLRDRAERKPGRAIVRAQTPWVFGDQTGRNLTRMHFVEGDLGEASSLHPPAGL
jgi:hypothetical protein